MCHAFSLLGAGVGGGMCGSKLLQEHFPLPNIPLPPPTRDLASSQFGSQPEIRHGTVSLHPFRLLYFTLRKPLFLSKRAISSLFWGCYSRWLSQLQQSNICRPVRSIGDHVYMFFSFNCWLKRSFLFENETFSMVSISKSFLVIKSKWITFDVNKAPVSNSAPY